MNCGCQFEGWMVRVTEILARVIGSELHHKAQPVLSQSRTKL